MRTPVKTICLGVAVAAAACDPAVAVDRLEVPSQTSMKVELQQTLNSERNGPGDQFKAAVSESVYGPGGEVLIPAGSSVWGMVTDIQEDPPNLQLEFQEMDVRGETLPINVELVSVTPRKHSEMRDEGAKIGGGAAAGAILGGVIGGDAKGAVIGAAAGAAAGTGVALATRDTHVYLPAGTLMNLRLARSIRVQKPSEEDAPDDGTASTG